MSSSTTPPYLYVFGGLLAIYAAYTTHCQLQAFKTRCVSKPPQQSNDAAVDRSTEDAIKLETLEALARGINFDLRNAALKIITERATTPENIDFLLNQISTRPPVPRLRALKALSCLTAAPGPLAGPFGALCTPRVFRTLVTTLKSTLPPTPDSATQKEVIYILTQLMKSYFVAKEMAVQAGIVEWLKAVDRSAVDVWDVLSCVSDTMEGRRLLNDANLLQDERVEVQVEVDLVDVNQWLPVPGNIVPDQ